MMKKLKERNGFTLIELIVVIAVLGILVLLAAPRFLGYTEDARLVQIKNDVKVYENVIDAERIDDDEFLANKSWPTVTTEELEEYRNSGSLVDKEGYVSEDEVFDDEYFAISEEIVNTNLEGDFILAEGGKVYYHDENLNGSNEGQTGEPGEPEEEVERVKIKDFVATDSDRNIIILEDDSLAVWGYGHNGLEAIEGIDPDGVGIAEVDGGLYHHTALRNDGSIAAWYVNDYQDDPWRSHVTHAPTTSDFTSVKSGAFFSVALKEDGSLDSWGYGESAFGRNGSGIDGEEEGTPVPAGNDFIAIDAGMDHGLALRSDGTIEVWGGIHYSDSYGIISDKPTDGGYIGISAGGYHSVAWKADGTVAVWGDNGNGQAEQPVVPEGEKIVTVSAGVNFNAALTDNNTLVSWGDPTGGMWAPDNTEILAPNGDKFIEVSAGSSQGLAMKENGEIVSWGYNYGETEKIHDDMPLTTK